ncbi:hypothetical protein BKA70DRAFT_226359 [Coprinopsis sp. MPI-PUGE-AT-0042]|nr:hypothetical protein BKA70DRAFT_226359 [Coprinopsis sp. MPI-PUGE-AT-0042]
MSSGKDFLAPPSEEYHHAQEGTSFSAAETVVDHQHERSKTMTNETEEFEVMLSDATPVSSPKDFSKPEPQTRATFSRGTCPPIIPPPGDRTFKTLILCFDGTGDQFDLDNSNIVQLVSLLQKDDKTKQMVYYQAGIGTYTGTHKVAKPWLSGVRKTLDLMLASSLHAHVMSGYEFLMQNYHAGDKICLFGFSRGAYTARGLAGMLHKVGLLPADNHEQIPFAYKMYQRTDDIGWEQSNEFKKAFSINVDIEFIGVWDTVDSVGLIPKRLPFTTSNTIVHTFRHAVSLDERRAKFKANLWNRPTAKEEKLGVPEPTAEVNALRKSLSKAPSEDDISIIKMRLPENDKKSSKKAGKESTKSKGRNSSLPLNLNRPSLRKQDSHERVLHDFERMYSSQVATTDIEEVWFAGCHCDVGGGSVSNKTRHSLARIPLRWMIRECFKANTGILFLSDRFPSIGMDPTTLYPYVTPRPPMPPLNDLTLRKHPTVEIPIRLHSMLKKSSTNLTIAKAAASTEPAFLASEEEEELRDALSPIYDQLTVAKRWWILEIVPMSLRYQRGDNQWVKYFGSNLARPRFIPKQAKNGVKVHRSVKLRMEAEYEEEKLRAKGTKYVPRAKLRVEPTWID